MRWIDDVASPIKQGFTPQKKRFVSSSTIDTQDTTPEQNSRENQKENTTVMCALRKQTVCAIRSVVWGSSQVTDYSICLYTTTFHSSVNAAAWVKAMYMWWHIVSSLCSLALHLLTVAILNFLSYQSAVRRIRDVFVYRAIRIETVAYLCAVIFTIIKYSLHFCRCEEGFETAMRVQKMKKLRQILSCSSILFLFNFLSFFFDT